MMLFDGRWGAAAPVRSSASRGAAYCQARHRYRSRRRRMHRRVSGPVPLGSEVWRTIFWNEMMVEGSLVRVEGQFWLLLGC